MAFPVSIALIDAAEKELGCFFPESLRERLVRANGGILLASSALWPEEDEWILFSVRDASDRKRLARSMTTFVDETASARMWKSFPVDGIAICSNGTGDMLVLLPESDDVWTWDHETGELFKTEVSWD